MNNNYPQCIWDKQDPPHDFKTGERIILHDTERLLAHFTLGKEYVVDGPGRWHDSIFVKDDKGSIGEVKASRFHRPPHLDDVALNAAVMISTTRNYLRTNAWLVSRKGIQKVEVFCTDLFNATRLYLDLEEARRHVIQKPRVPYVKT